MTTREELNTLLFVVTFAIVKPSLMLPSAIKVKMLNGLDDGFLPRIFLWHPVLIILSNSFVQRFLNYWVAPLTVVVGTGN
ncbi:hypothetical protein D5086_005682 [Populus alba]|uniref:Uncharacterized protein n=1 Tax=Populus alba TaxID=43335 RepID=A0ACC4CVI3_POPAL